MDSLPSDQNTTQFYITPFTKADERELLEFLDRSAAEAALYGITPDVSEINWEPFQDPPPAWTEDDKSPSPSMQRAKEDVARLLVNTCLFDPPIEDKEIEAYAKFFEVPFRQAELEIRRERDED